MSTLTGLALWALIIWICIRRIRSRRPHRRPRRRPRSPGLDPVRFASRQQRQALWRRQRGLCAWCGTSLRGYPVECHHVVPLSRGGRTVLSNLVLLHDSCHDEVTRQQASVYGWRRAA